MAELHIDDDWKKQAQEEKRRITEQAEKAKAAAPAGPAGVLPSAPAAAQSRGTGRAPDRSSQGRGQREMPDASFTTLVQSILTQVLLYVGELAVRGSEGMLNLDIAKHHLDTLSILEEKTRGNLTTEEKEILDNVLYEARMRFITVSSRYAELP